ncbi:MauE/DoxX family redox-associated membrane protein [Geothrix fuzhouensis]|uniref:MauE/DoxX family redox-associated membrane protein n=1 Tax=Geothrix fuzhouensis TaxID=2966451 RepID=UPI002148D77D|nr:MauE/DoxX family redox-associated membrane protein [Geothrix fuzhouensis]
MSPRLRRWLLHPRLSLAVRIALGLVFIAAALPKIGDPPGFAKAIWAYQLVPGKVLNPMALVLPWLELVCGLALCLGVWIRAALTWVALLLLAFSLALTLNLARNHPVDCGCFGGTTHRTDAERLTDMRWLLLRDVGLLLLAAQILLATHPRKN